MLKDKNALKSMSVWGAALLALAQSLEDSGVLVPGTTIAVSTIAASVGTFLTVVGVRKAIGA